MTQIIGNGMIAKSFSSHVFSKDFLILAAGVSNSLEERATEFQREENLVIKAIKHCPGRKVIYFSTCSILQAIKTPYIAHKMRMEKIIASESDSSVIVRLPQAVGIVKNTTLVSYLVTQILKGQHITIQQTAKRNLIDVDDVARIVHQLIEDDIVKEGVINIASKKSIFVADIVTEIAKILKKSYSSSYVSSGESYEIPLDFLENYLLSTDPLLNEKYWVGVLSKYVPLIRLSIE